LRRPGEVPGGHDERPGSANCIDSRAGQNGMTAQGSIPMILRIRIVRIYTRGNTYTLPELRTVLPGNPMNPSSPVNPPLSFRMLPASAGPLSRTGLAIGITTFMLAPAPAMAAGQNEGA